MREGCRVMGLGGAAGVTARRGAGAARESSVGAFFASLEAGEYPALPGHIDALDGLVETRPVAHTCVGCHAN